MSLSVGGSLPVVRVDDKRLNISDKQSVPVRISANQISYLQQVAQSTGNVASYNIPMPNPAGSVLSPKVLNRTQGTVNVVVAANETGNPLIQPGITDSLAAFPFQRSCQNITLQLNNESFSFPQWQDVGTHLRKFSVNSYIKDVNGGFPWYPDGASTYEQLYGSLRDPLSAAAGQDMDFMRGAFANFTVSAVTPTSATISFDIVEPLVGIGLIDWSCNEGIPYVQNWALTFSGINIAKMFSHSAPAGVSVTIPDSGYSLAAPLTCTLYYQSVACNLLEKPLPPIVRLPNVAVNVSTSPGTVSQALITPPNLPAGSTLVSNQITLTAIPRRIYVFAVPSVITSSSNTPDLACAYMGNFQLTFNGRPVLTNLIPQQFSTLARDAGYSLPLQQWLGYYAFADAANGAVSYNGGTGSVLCIRPGVDFELSADEAVGMLKQTTFQVQGNFHCPRAGEASISATLYVVSILDSITTISSAFEESTQVGVVSSQDLLAASAEAVSEQELQYGGAKHHSMYSHKEKRMLHHHKGHGVHSAGAVASAGSSMTAGASVYSGGATMKRKTIKDRLH